MRGLAALSVFVFHCGLIPQFWNNSSHFPGILGDGRAAVDLFFVLSGFVLARSLLGDRSAGYLAFIVKRIARIYPAYWTALLLCAVLIPMYDANSHPFFDKLTRGFWARPAGWEQWFLHFSLVAPGIDRGRINGVIWSLIIEMRISLCMPFLVWLCCSLPVRGRLILFSLACPVFMLLGQTAAFVPLFLIGILLAIHFQSNGTVSRVTLLSLFLVGGLFYGNREIGDLPFRQETGSVSDLLSGIGAGILIFVAIKSSLCERFLTTLPVQFLGDVSYSFYLLHWPILLYITSCLLVAGYSPMMCAALSLTASWISAYLAFLYIEKPGMKLGSRLAAQMVTPVR
jgi:peptidoglycan/LPS O-acetylase OafA/YrhL